MARVQIHCYGCSATTAVSESRMADDLRLAGWAVSHGKTYCHTCAAQRVPEGVTSSATPPPAPSSPSGAGADEAGAAPWDAPLPDPVETVGTLGVKAFPDYYASVAKEGRFSRAFRLMRTALVVLRRDPRLLIFPVVALVAGTLASFGAFALAGAQVHGNVQGDRAAYLAWGFFASLPATYITLFCGVALACMLSSHLDGEPMSVSEALSAATRRAAVIAAWTVLVCTVGMLLRVVEQGWPRIVRALVNTSWSLLTAFAIPILAYEQLGPFATLKRSRALLGQRWPEQIIGAGAFGIAGGLLTLPCIGLIVAGLLTRGPTGTLLIGLGTVSLVLLLVVQNAAEQVYRICLYRYATGVDVPSASPFEESDLARPFVGRRRGI